MDDTYQLNIEEQKTLKKALKRLDTEGTRLTRKDIITIIEEIKKHNKPKKIRHSGHFVDQKLKYKEPALSENISQETQEKVGEEIRTEGIKLSPPQDKLINALMKLLHEKSEHSNQFSENFYGGNSETMIVPYGGSGQQEKARVIRISPSELYTSYLDKTDYSGKEIENIY
jgi:hypothetical protein